MVVVFQTKSFFEHTHGNVDRPTFTFLYFFFFSRCLKILDLNVIIIHLLFFPLHRTNKIRLSHPRSSYDWMLLQLERGLAVMVEPPEYQMT